MALSIDTFLASGIKKEGLSKPYLFEVSINKFNNSLSFWAKGASIPGHSVNMVGIPFQGRLFKYPGEKNFADFSITVINQENYDLRKEFELWAKEISDNLTGGSTRNIKKIWRNIIVSQFKSDHSESTIYFELHDAFIVDISPMELNWENVSATQDFTVTFSYQYYTDSLTKPISFKDINGFSQR